MVPAFASVPGARVHRRCHQRDEKHKTTFTEQATVEKFNRNLAEPMFGHQYLPNG